MIKAKAVCKWWSDAKGYGFVTVDNVDVFCHYSALKGEGFKTLREGQSLTIDYVVGAKGAQVIETVDWKEN